MHTNPSEKIWLILAAQTGLLSAVVALHSSDLQFAVLFLFVQCMVFGFARPSGAWRWACLIAICIPLAVLLNVLVTIPSPRELEGPARLFLGPALVFLRSTQPVTLAMVPASAFAVIPALCGAYAGAWMNRATAQASEPLS